MNSSFATKDRLDYLDSLRGIAAFIVVTTHCCVMWPSLFLEVVNDPGLAVNSASGFITYVLFRIMTQGRAAVIIFFVLSGFVLASSLVKHPTSYVGFVVKRVLRIYPAFFVAILASYLLHMLIGPPATVYPSDWFNDSVANPPLSFAKLMGHLLMRGTRTTDMLDNVIWSLVHEMRVSLVFPLIFAGVRRYRWRALPVALFISLFAAYSFVRAGVEPKGFNAETDAQSWIMTLYFSVFFVFGILVFLEQDFFKILINRLPRTGKYLLLLFICVFLCQPTAGTPLSDCVCDYLYGIAAVMLIALALNFNGFREALRKRVLVWLGRISYSLYLIHIPIIFVAYTLMWRSVPYLYISAAVIAVALASAEITARFVEIPFMRMGKVLAKKLPANH